MNATLAHSEQLPFGISVSGVDLAKTTEPEIDQLKRWLGQHGVAVLRNAFAAFDAVDHTSRDAAFVKFLARFGAMTFTEGETPVPHQPMLNCVSNVGRSTPPKSVFHTDTSYVIEPPAYTALRAVCLPEQGGDTVFCDQYVAYETLPLEVKQRLACAQVLHQVSGLSADQLASAAPASLQNWHPLFKLHPISGRKALFISTPQRCRAMTGFSDEHAQRILRLLYRHSIRAHRVKAHRWQADDLLIWDNRCTMHRGDHASVIGNRIFHRGMVMATSSN